MLTICRFIKKLNLVMGYISAPLIGVVALITLYEVMVRYFFHDPTSWAQEVCEYVLCALVMLGAGYTLRHYGHTRVDIVHSRLSPTAKAWVEIFTGLFLLVLTMPIIWIGTGIAVESFVVHELAATAAELPLWPSKATVPLGALLLLLQGISNAMENIHFLISGSQPQYS